MIQFYLFVLISLLSIQNVYCITRYYDCDNYLIHKNLEAVWTPHHCNTHQSTLKYHLKPRHYQDLFEIDDVRIQIQLNANEVGIDLSHSICDLNTKQKCYYQIQEEKELVGSITLNIPYIDVHYSSIIQFEENNPSRIIYKLCSNQKEASL